MRLEKRLEKDEHLKSAWYCVHVPGELGSCLGTPERNGRGKIY